MPPSARLLFGLAAMIAISVSSGLAQSMDPKIVVLAAPKDPTKAPC